MAELIRQRLGEAGVAGWTVKSVDPKTRDARVRSWEYELALFGPRRLGIGSGLPDPSFFRPDFRREHGSLPIRACRGFEAPELMDLLDQPAERAIDPEKRKELVIRIQRLLDRPGAGDPLVLHHRVQRFQAGQI